MLWHENGYVEFSVDLQAKKYYNLSEGDIYALIIPIQYHVTKKEIQTMAQAENMEQVYGVIKNSWYKCQNIEELMDQALEMRQRSLQIRSMSLPAGKSLIQQQY